VVGAVLPVTSTALVLTGVVQVIGTSVVATDEPTAWAVERTNTEPETYGPTTRGENRDLV